MTDDISTKEGVPRILPEDRVTLHELERLLNSMRLLCDSSDGILSIVDGIDVVCSINLETEWKNVRISSCFDHRGPRSKVLEKINELNGEMIFARFHCIGEKAIGADFFISYEGGLNVQQFGSQIRRFAETVGAVGGFIFSGQL